MTELAKVLGLTEEEFEIFRDYEQHGMPATEKLEILVRHEAARRRCGGTPITGEMAQQQIKEMKSR